MLVASEAEPSTFVLAPAVEAGPMVPEVVTDEAGLVVSSVMVSLEVELTLPILSFTSRQTDLAPSLEGKVWEIVPPPVYEVQLAPLQSVPSALRYWAIAVSSVITKATEVDRV